MSDLVILAASAGGVAFMVAVAALLGFRQRARVDEQSLTQLAAVEGGHVEVSAIDARANAGVARLAGGRWLVARVMADGIGARVFAAESVRVRATSGAITLAFEDIGFPALTLKFNEAPTWLKEMAA